MDWLNVIFTFILGLCVGSFYNVVALRALEGISPFKGRSRCPHCLKCIEWYDLIPVVSYMVLRGRCRNCQKSISPLYALGELGTGVIFALMYIRYGFTVDTIMGLILATIIVISTITDFKERLILDKITLPGLIVLFILQAVFNTGGLVDGMVGALGMLAVFFVINFIKPDGIGGGDVKLFMPIAIVLGFKWSMIVLMLASAIALIVYLPPYLMKKIKNEIPFGPYIGLATIVVYLLQGTPPYEFVDMLI